MLTLRGRIDQALLSIDTEPTQIYKIVYRYCCRLLGAYDFKKAVHTTIPKEGKPIILIKDFLDYSSERNKILAAIKSIPNTYEEEDIVQASLTFGVACEDIQTCLAVLNTSELDEIFSRPPVHILSEESISSVIKHLGRIISNLVHRQLRYVLMSTSSVTTEDLIGDLQAQAIKLLRHYEIDGRSEEHLIKTVVVGLKNYTDNLAWTWGRKKRQPMIRVRKVPNSRKAWFFSPKTREVSQVRVPGDKKSRSLSNGNLCVRVHRENTKEELVVPLSRLYETEGEARRARLLWACGFPSKRARTISLNQKLDEFQNRCVSIDSPLGEGKSSLLDILPPAYGTDQSKLFLKDIKKHVTPSVAEFVSLVTSINTDPLFNKWCMDQGIDPTQVEVRRLGRLAASYLGLSQAIIREALLDTPTSLWSNSSLAILKESASNG